MKKEKKPNKRFYKIVKNQSTKLGQFRLEFGFSKNSKDHEICTLNVFHSGKQVHSFCKTMKCHPEDSFNQQFAQREAVKILNSRFEKAVSRIFDLNKQEILGKTKTIFNKVDNILVKVYQSKTAKDKEIQLNLFNE